MSDTGEELPPRSFGLIGKTTLGVVVIAALFVFYYAIWFAVDMVELAHDVPSPWTLSDLSLISLPISVLAIALAAAYALLRGRLSPLWISVAAFALVALIVVTSE